MGRWKRWSRDGWMVAAIAIMAVGVLAGDAADALAWRDEDLFLRSEDLRTVLFGSMDAGRSVFVSGGAKRALTGPLDRTGFVAFEVSGFGLTRERYDLSATTSRATRFTTDTAALLGYQWVVPGLYVGTFLGPELHQEQLDVALAKRASKPRLGARSITEIWANPTADTLLTLTFIAGSTQGSLSGRVSAGYRIAGDVFVGPEASAYGNATYGEMKLGLHATGLQIGILHARLSGGLQWQDDRREPAPYVALASWIRL